MAEALSQQAVLMPGYRPDRVAYATERRALKTLWEVLRRGFESARDGTAPRGRSWLVPKTPMPCPRCAEKGGAAPRRTNALHGSRPSIDTAGIGDRMPPPPAPGCSRSDTVNCPPLGHAGQGYKVRRRRRRSPAPAPIGAFGPARRNRRSPGPVAAPRPPPPPPHR